MFGCQLSFYLWWTTATTKQTSCLTTAFLEILCGVFLSVSLECSWLSVCLVWLVCHMPSRTTWKCRETLLQVKQRLRREQDNRTQKRVSELLASGEEDSSSDSEEDQDNSPEEICDSLSAIRRDLYLGLLSLLLLFLLLAIWLRSVSLQLEPFLH